MMHLMSFSLAWFFFCVPRALENLHDMNTRACSMPLL